MKKISKRFKGLIEQQKKEKIDSLEKKIESVKKMSNAKFVESIDLSFKLNLKKIKSSESSLRTVIELPNGNGKKLKVAVLCDANKLADAKKSGADIYGSEDLIKVSTIIVTPNVFKSIVSSTTSSIKIIL